MLAQFYPPDIGGEERHVRNLSPSRSRRGVTTSRCSLLRFPLRAPDRSVEDGILIRTGPQRARSACRSTAILRVRTPCRSLIPRCNTPSAEQIERGHYDVVHAHNWIVNSAISPTKRHAGPARAHPPRLRAHLRRQALRATTAARARVRAPGNASNARLTTTEKSRVQRPS